MTISHFATKTFIFCPMRQLISSSRHSRPMTTGNSLPPILISSPMIWQDSQTSPYKTGTGQRKSVLKTRKRIRERDCQMRSIFPSSGRKCVKSTSLVKLLQFLIRISQPVLTRLIQISGMPTFALIVGPIWTSWSWCIPNPRSLTSGTTSG